MKNLLRFLIVAALLVFAARAADDVVSAVHGTVTKLDSGTKTMVVKTKDGTEHTVHFVDKTAVYGADKTAAGAKDSFKGLSEGSEVVVHYTKKGAVDTATEVDKVGKDGLKSIDGTVTKVGKDGKTVVVKGADGTEQTFEVAGHDTADAAKDSQKKIDEIAEAGRALSGPAGQPECVWLGRRVVALLWRDDLDTAFRHLDLYDRFGCPSAHVQATFRCLIRQGALDPKAQDTLNGRVHACWVNPALEPVAEAAQAPVKPANQAETDAAASQKPH